MQSDRARSVAGEPPQAARLPHAPHLTRPLVLVGLMGAGKSSVGRRLSRALAVPFRDADDEIVAAAGMSIPDIFERYGEPEFRHLERRVVGRLLDGVPMVLALGGGAFIDAATRAVVKARAHSVWLRADLDTLVERTNRKRGTRPLLATGDPRQILAELMERRYPIYAEADHVVDSTEQPHEVVVYRILDLLRRPAVAP
jgi:shikimate kinase